MKLYKSLMALTLAGVMFACSDDNKYTPGAASPGAYFPADLSEQVELTEGASSVSIPVYRASSSGSSTATIAYTDDSGLFTLTSNTVNFTDGSNKSEITFNYDPSKIVVEEKYNANLQITEGASIYGVTDYSFYFELPAALIAEDWGTGTYLYTGVLDGTDSGLPVQKAYTETNPNNITFIVNHWAFDVDLKITCDMSKKNPDGSYTIDIPSQPIGYVTDEKGPIEIIINWRLDELLGREVSDDDKNANTFNPETGLFSMFVAYWLPDTWDGESLNWYGNTWEYLQMDGYPDYNISLSYDGIYTDKNGLASYVMGTITTGPDFDNVKVAVGSGKDINSIVAGIMDESITSIDINAGVEEEKFELKIPGADTYTLVAVGIAGGEVIVVQSESFVVGEWVVESGNWEELGETEYVDGWITPGWTRNNLPLNPFKFPYKVMVEKNLDYPEVYRLVNPYGQDSGNTVAGQNSSDVPRNIVFDASDPDFVVFMPQNSGFQYSSQFTYIADRAGMAIESGASKEEAKESIMSEGLCSELYNGVVTVVRPYFSDDECVTWYYYRSKYPTEFALPDGNQSQAAANNIRHATGRDGNYTYTPDTNQVVIKKVPVVRHR